MSPVAHTAACNAHQRDLDAFDARYPNHCRACGGRGAWHDPGVYRHADGSGTPPDGGPCKCVEEGKCPLCAGSLRTVEERFADWGVCPACGWDERKAIEGKEPSRPDFDCTCGDLAA